MFFSCLALDSAAFLALVFFPAFLLLLLLSLSAFLFGECFIEGLDFHLFQDLEAITSFLGFSFSLFFFLVPSLFHESPTSRLPNCRTRVVLSYYATCPSYFSFSFVAFFLLG